MALECPVTAYRLAGGGRIVFNRSPGMAVVEVLQVPCGRCALCRQRNARDWQLRLVHEASLHKQKCFLTLTYDNVHLPADGGLRVEHMQKFFKDLRYRLERDHEGAKIRNFYIGEYGGQTRRPHYHAILFGFDFPDKTKWAGSGQFTRYKSVELEEIWGRGMAELGSVTPASAAYVGSYVLKKHNGPQHDHEYLRFDPQSGRSWYVPREFAHMSSGGGGIGAAFLDKWTSDIFPHDYCVVEGRKVSVPRFYSRKFKAGEPAVFEQIAARRKAEGEARQADNTPERRAVKEQVAIARQALKQRNKV